MPFRVYHHFFIVIFLPLISVIAIPVYGEQPRSVKSYTQRVDTIDISDEHYIVRDKEGYTAFLPQKRPYSGAVVFFMGKRIDDTPNALERNMIEPSLKKKLAVIYISSGNYLDFYFEESDLEKIDSTLAECLKKHRIPADRLMFAGSGLGGTRATKFAIYCEEKKSKFGIRPRALVICDSPLDMLRVWEEGNRAIHNNFNPASKEPSQAYLQYLEVGMAGKPENKKKNYINYSPFIYTQPEGGNARHLDSVPVRAYHDPDVEWWINNRRKDFYSMNSIDLAAFINQLKLLGNKNATLISAKPKKVKKGNTITPGSWSIVDPKELVEWFYTGFIEVKKRKE